MSSFDGVFLRNPLDVEWEVIDAADKVIHSIESIESELSWKPARNLDWYRHFAALREDLDGTSKNLNLSMMYRSLGASDIYFNPGVQLSTIGEFGELVRRAPGFFLGIPSVDTPQKLASLAFELTDAQRAVLRQHFGDEWLVWCFVAFVWRWKSVEHNRRHPDGWLAPQLPDITRTLGRMQSSGLDIDTIISYVDALSGELITQSIQSDVALDMIPFVSQGRVA